MAIRIPEATFGTVLLALVCIAGCNHKPSEQGVLQSQTSWQTPAATNQIPGIDEATVTSVTLKAGPPQGVPFVVWSDLPNGTAGRGEGTAQGAFYEGGHSATDGRHVEFRARTIDGKTGLITIAGVDYDLAKGSLFLISTGDNPPTVAQIPIDSSGFPKGDAIKEFARSNLQVRGFFENHKKARNQRGHGT